MFECHNSDTMQSVVRAASIGQLSRASAVAIPSNTAGSAAPVPASAAAPAVQAPGTAWFKLYRQEVPALVFVVYIGTKYQ